MTDSGEKLLGWKTKLHPRGRLLPPEHPDVSSILKIAGPVQAEEPDELFDPPLHSTAVSSYEEDEDRSAELGEVTSNSSDSEPEKKNTIGSKTHHTVNSRRKRKDSEEETLKENVMPRVSAKSQREEEEKSSSSEMETDHSDSEAELHLVKVYKSKGMKKVTRCVTQVDVILHKFEKITSKYKQGVDQDIYRKVIDRFYTSFKDQLTNSDTNAEELRKTKLKNMKMMRETNKKRQRLIDVQEELIKTEPQLKKLVKEYAGLKKKITSLKNAVQLVTSLKDLQEKYINYRQENPQEKIVYGVSSLPALLVESQRILGAEGHFRTINSKLEEMMDMQKEN
uniref:Centromere protein U n=1 Tax=Salvator merianae TaxID=96440 RepID=A0A8D0BSS8_SALMN